MSKALRTAYEYCQVIAALLAELIPRDEYDRWILSSHSVLNGD